MDDDEPIVVKVPCSRDLAEALAMDARLRERFARQVADEASRRLIADMDRLFLYGKSDPSDD